ncbi:MAG: pilus assembly protein PilM, partial [Planctomycetota bacterium]
VEAERRELRRSRRGRSSSAGLDTLTWEQAGPIVSELLRRGGFRGRRVNAALPRSMQMIKTLRLPTEAKDEVPQLIAKEANNAFGVDVTSGEFIVHFLSGDRLRRTDDQQQEGLLAIAKRTDVDAFVTSLHDWGAIVDAVDFAPVALFRGISRFGRRVRDQDDVHVLVDIGRMQTQVMIGRGSSISFHKSIGIGGETLNAAVARKLGLTTGEATLVRRRLNQQARLALAEAPRDADPVEVLERLEDDPVHHGINVVTRAVVEDLARELSLCLRYYSVTFRSRPPELFHLCGGVAEDPVLCMRLKMASAVPMHVHDPLADVVLQDDRTGLHQPGQWSLATGLAMRKAPQGLATSRGVTRDRQQAADQEAGNVTSPAVTRLTQESAHV